KSSQPVSFRALVTVGVRRCVAPIQPYLVCAQPAKLDNELLIELHSTLCICIDLHHPTLYTIRIELLIPRRVERVREVAAPAIAADLDHLRTTVERLLGLLRVSRSAHDATEVERAGLLRTCGNGDGGRHDRTC